MKLFEPTIPKQREPVACYVVLAPLLRDTNSGFVRKGSNLRPRRLRPCATNIRRPLYWPRENYPSAMTTDDKSQSGINKDDDASEQPKESGGNNEKDWDAAWNEFSESRSGGTFQLPPNMPPSDRETQKSNPGDQRIDKLTSAWSNENGFLIGIAVILLIAAFYAYVYQSGGISS